MIEINNTTRQKINLARTKNIVENFLRVYKKSKKEVSLAIVGPERMRRLNNDYRGQDATTDVLSFGSERGGGKNKEKNKEEGKYLGEVIININETKKASKYLEVFGRKKSAEYIFYFLLVHGLLHLIGYSDEKEGERLKMLNEGEKFLKEYI